MAFVVAPVDGKAEKRIAPEVFVGGVEVHIVFAVGEVVADEGDFAGAVVVVQDGFFPFRTPSGGDRLGKGVGFADGERARAASEESAAAKEGDVGVVEDVAVEIVEHKAGSAGAHETIERLVEEGGGGVEHDLVSEIAADGAAAGGRVVRLAELGEEQEARVVEGPGGEEDEVGRLEKFLAAGVGVGDTADFGFVLRLRG